MFPVNSNHGRTSVVLFFKIQHCPNYFESFNCSVRLCGVYLSLETLTKIGMIMHTPRNRDSPEVPVHSRIVSCQFVTRSKVGLARLVECRMAERRLAEMTCAFGIRPIDIRWNGFRLKQPTRLNSVRSASFTSTRSVVPVTRSWV